MSWISRVFAIMSSIFDSKLHFACTLPTYKATLPVSLLDCPLFPHPAMTLFRDTMQFIRRHFSARCLPDKSFIVQSATRDNVHSEPDNASVKGSYLFAIRSLFFVTFKKKKKNIPRLVSTPAKIEWEYIQECLLALMLDTRGNGCRLGPCHCYWSHSEVFVCAVQHKFAY